MITAGVPLPSVNQLHHNIYGRAPADVVAFCQAHNIHVQSYSPLGVPDHISFKPPCAPVLLEDPVLLSIAAAHGMTPAQVALAQAGASPDRRSEEVPRTAVEQLPPVGAPPAPRAACACAAADCDLCDFSSGSRAWLCS